MSMKRYPWPVLASLVLSLAGAVLCAVLLGVHVEGKAGGGWISSVCGGEGGGCDKVVNSRWGVFPPAPAGADGEERGGSIPVAALGLFYFSVLAIWFGLVGRLPWEQRWLHRVVVGLCSLGALASVGFLVLMAAVVKTWCPLCLGSHVVNFALLGTAILAGPRKPESSESTTKAKRSAAPGPQVAGYPGVRTAVVVHVLLIVAVCVAEWKGYEASRLRAENEKISEVLESLRQDGDWLDVVYFGKEKHDVEIRDDDPVLPALPGLRNTLVYFSDIECPSCARFDRRLFEEIRPLYEGHLRIVFKHYPLSNHPNALAAAKAIEAARLQGKFWQMRDALLDRREQLGVVNYAEVAQSLGMDRQRFVIDMSSPQTLARIQEDKRYGASLGVRGTPGVFLNGRHVDRSIRDLLMFWKQRAAALRKTREAGGAGWGARAEGAPGLQAPPKRIDP